MLVILANLSQKEEVQLLILITIKRCVDFSQKTLNLCSRTDQTRIELD